MSKAVGGTQKTTSVWLGADKNTSGEHRLQMFKCNKCSIPVIQFKGDVIKILPGETPYIPKTILKCKGNFKNEDGVWEECSMLYEFMGVSDFIPKNG